MVIRFLGTSNGFISPSRWQTGVLIRDKITILLDCGAPVAHLMAREKIDPNLIDVLWLSHSHSDHMGQFPSLIQHLWLQKRSKTLRIIGPALLLKRLQEWLPVCMLFPKLLPFKIEWSPVPLKKPRPVTVSGLRFTPHPTRHLYSLRDRFGKGLKDVCFETLAFKVDRPGLSIAFSTDLDKPSDLVGLIEKPLDLLVCEMTHFTPEELFAQLSGAPIKKLILTHFPDKYLTWEKKMQKLALAAGFTGKVLMADDGKKFSI